MEKEQSCFIREKKEKNFTVMSNYHLRSENLSWKAKGVFSYLLSLPDDWVIYLSELKKHATDGRDSLRTAIRELEENGFISKKRIKDELNRFCGYRYTIHETPIKTSSTADFPYTAFPATETPAPEKQLLLSTNSLSNTNNKKDLLYKTEKEVVETVTVENTLFPDIPVKQVKEKKQDEKKTKNKHGVHFRVILDGYEYEAMTKEIGEEKTKKLIERADNWLFNNSIKNVKNHYRMMMKWYEKEKQEEQDKIINEFRPVVKKEKNCPLCGGVLRGSACTQCYANFDSEGNEI